MARYYSEGRQRSTYKWRENNPDRYKELQRKYCVKQYHFIKFWRELCGLGGLYIE